MELVDYDTMIIATTTTEKVTIRKNISSTKEFDEFKGSAVGSRLLFFKKKIILGDGVIFPEYSTVFLNRFFPLLFSLPRKVGSQVLTLHI